MNGDIGAREEARQEKNAYKRRALAAEKTLKELWLAVERHGDRAAIQAARHVMAKSEALIHTSEAAQ